jgi:hypothetical protein
MIIFQVLEITEDVDNDKDKEKDKTVGREFLEAEKLMTDEVNR